jgi:hypothetical protein
MIDLAISIDDDTHGITIIETNRGECLKAPKWPQDSDFRLVVFKPDGKECDVIAPDELANDIARALEAIRPTLRSKGKRPAWYRRLQKCAAGANTVQS